MATKADIPNAQEREAFKRKLWNVPKAIGSFKVHYLYKRIAPKLDQNLGSRENYKFEDMFPDTNPASSGVNPLSPAGKASLFRQMGLRDNKDFVKHLLNHHDGESRIVIDKGFIAPLPPRDADILDPKFWNYQYVSNFEVRRFLYERDEKQNLTYRDVRWIMHQEGYQTKILKWNPPASSGARPNIRAEDFSLRQGNFITLAELFDFGQHILSCYHLYIMYLNMEIYIQKKVHSQSASEEATLRDNAKRLCRQENGRYALPREGDTWDSYAGHERASGGFL